MLITLEIRCPFCGKASFVDVLEEDCKKFQTGELLAQDCFPYLDASERELLITGICFECQNKIFKEV